MAIKVFGFKSGNRLQRKDTFFQYSTNEQFTGEYWIDGKKIYCRTYNFGTITGGLTYLTTVDGLDKIIEMTSFYTLGSPNGNKQTGHSPVFASPDNRLHCNFDDNAYNFVLTLWYTKTTD